MIFHQDGPGRLACEIDSIFIFIGYYHNTYTCLTMIDMFLVGTIKKLLIFLFESSFIRTWSTLNLPAIFMFLRKRLFMHFMSWPNRQGLVLFFFHPDSIFFIHVYHSRDVLPIYWVCRVFNESRN